MNIEDHTVQYWPLLPYIIVQHSVTLYNIFVNVNIPVVIVFFVCDHCHYPGIACIPYLLEMMCAVVSMNDIYTAYIFVQIFCDAFLK